jgi:uncharacterized protein (TIGR02117 family)
MEKRVLKSSSLLSAAMFLLVQGCLGPVKELYPPAPEQRTVSVYIVSHGWHAGIAVHSEDIPMEVWIKDDVMPPVRFLEIGWGDQGYYQAPRINLGLILKASFWPTPSVMHLAGFNLPVSQYFAASQVIEVRISEEGMRELAKFITASFQTDEEGRGIPKGSGLYGTYSFFYKAEGYYYLPKTSNMWTAQALRSTGAPITPIYGFTAGNVTYQAGRIGKVLNKQE